MAAPKDEAWFTKHRLVDKACDFRGVISRTHAHLRRGDMSYETAFLAFDSMRLLQKEARDLSVDLLKEFPELQKWMEAS